MKRIFHSIALWEGEVTLTGDQLAAIERAGSPLKLTPPLVDRLQQAFRAYAETVSSDRVAVPTKQVKARLAAVAGHAEKASNALWALAEKGHLAECVRERIEMAMHADPGLRQAVPAPKELRALALRLSDLAGAAQRASKSLPKPAKNNKGRKAKAPGLDAFLLAGDAIFDAAGGYKKKRRHFHEALLQVAGWPYDHASVGKMRLVDKAKRKQSGKAPKSRKR